LPFQAEPAQQKSPGGFHGLLTQSDQNKFPEIQRARVYHSFSTTLLFAGFWVILAAEGTGKEKDFFSPSAAFKLGLPSP